MRFKKIDVRAMGNSVSSRWHNGENARIDVEGQRQERCLPPTPVKTPRKFRVKSRSVSETLTFNGPLILSTNSSTPGLSS